MAVSLLTRVNAAVQRIKQQIIILLRGYPPDVCLAVAGLEIEKNPTKSKFCLKDILGDGFLWAVPKHRRTIEKRLKRKFGHPDHILKILLPKTYLRTCNVCGDDYEAGVLCPTCYKKVIDETKLMQEAIKEELKLDPVENEVVVVYQGEKENTPPEIFEGKRIVEMEKPRPPWFSKNLLQGSSQKPAQTSDVKPSDLG